MLHLQAPRAPKGKRCTSRGVPRSPGAPRALSGRPDTDTGRAGNVKGNMALLGLLDVLFLE